MNKKSIQELRAQAQTLNVTVHIGKGGIDAAVDELKAQIKARKLVKVRLLPAATEGASDKEQAEALAEACDATLVEVRGHTAVYWKG